MPRSLTRLLIIASTVAALVALPAAASAASVAYVANGEVWLSSLDGAKQVKLAGPVAKSDETGSWT